MEKLQNKIRVRFKNKRLLKEAFVHRSYLNENPKSSFSNNERLEFLGDAVLELAVSECLYFRYRKKPEGVLTAWRAALVKGSTLTKVARNLKLGQYLKLSRGEEKSGGRGKDMILADTVEALIGAIYIDQGFKTAQKFIDNFIIKYLDEIIKNGQDIDAKTALQEMSQEKTGITPTYRVLAESGPDHNKKFKIGVYSGKRLIGIGTGPSKQKAQESAAKDGLESVGEKLSNE